jgi:3-dehydroquinate dehydratase-2
MKILVVNGPNLNLLGLREPEIYGSITYKELCEKIVSYCKDRGCHADCFQSNCEGEIITAIQKAKGVYDGIIINAGALTHYSYPIYDALKYADLPTVEVHISNLYKREEFRHKSVISAAYSGMITGLGIKLFALR